MPDKYQRYPPLAALFTALGVIFPLFFHLVGLGSTFLPMFLPILMGGMLLPLPFALSIAVLTPIISFLFTGMPPVFPPILPIMIVELIIISGIGSILYFTKKVAAWLTLLIAVAADRLALFLILSLLLPLLDLPRGILTTAAVLHGIPGIILMFLVIPAALRQIERKYPRLLPQNSKTEGETSPRNHREFFNHYAENWEETSEERKALKNIFSSLKLDLAGNILDVGCGTGILVPVVAETSANKHYLIELDMAKEMLRQNRRRWSSPAGKIAYLNADVHSLPFPDGRINTLLCFAAFPHFQDKPAVIREFYRVLPSGGILLILHLMSSQKLNEFHRDVGSVVGNDRLPPVDVLSDELARSGFKILHQEERDDLYLIYARKG